MAEQEKQQMTKVRVMVGSRQGLNPRVYANGRSFEEGSTEVEVDNDGLFKLARRGDMVVTNVSGQTLKVVDGAVQVVAKEAALAQSFDDDKAPSKAKK